MSAPLLWVILPILAALAAMVGNRRERLVAILLGLLAVLLTALAAALPIGEIVAFGPLRFELTPDFTVLGRSLQLNPSERGIVSLVYAHAAIWILLAGPARVGRYFVPLSMLFSALLLGMLLVDPIIFAPLLSLLAMFSAVPMLSRPEQLTSMGIMRMLTFQALGAPFILFAGSLLARIVPSDPETDTALAIVLIGFGFALMLGIFPFHAWLPLVSARGHPHAVSFVFQLQPIMIALFGFGFFAQIPWLRDAPEFYALLRFVGLMTLLAGGIFVAFQRNLARIFGHAAVAESGLLLAVLGLDSNLGLTLFFGLVIARGLAYALWAQALSVVKQTGKSLDLEAFQGYLKQEPLVASALLVSIFSIAGLPVLGSFPLKFIFWETAAPIDISVTFAALLGSLGIAAGGLRMLWIFIGDPVTTIEPSDSSRLPRLILQMGISILILIGLLPQPLLWLARSIPVSFLTPGQGP